MLLSFYSLFFWIGHFILQGTTSIEIISLFDIFLFSLIIFIAFKYLLPAHWEKIPLELNEQGIVDSVRKRTISLGYDTKCTTCEVVRCYYISHCLWFNKQKSLSRWKTSSSEDASPTYWLFLPNSCCDPTAICCRWQFADFRISEYFVRRKNGA